jgi:hypothetical protein
MQRGQAIQAWPTLLLGLLSNQQGGVHACLLAEEGEMIAIDPGVAGGWAYDMEHGAIECCRMPETDGDILTGLRNLYAVGHREIRMELPAKAIFGAGHSSLAVLHRNVGFIQGVAMAIGFSLILVQPKAWQKVIGLSKRQGEEQRKWKNRLKEEAQRRFPCLHITLSTADAVLILAAGLAAKNQTRQ